MISAMFLDNINMFCSCRSLWGRGRALWCLWFGTWHTADRIPRRVGKGWRGTTRNNPRISAAKSRRTKNDSPKTTVKFLFEYRVWEMWWKDFLQRCALELREHKCFLLSIVHLSSKCNFEAICSEKPSRQSTYCTILHSNPRFSYL